jgi:dienelactone hydrolase
MLDKTSDIAEVRRKVAAFGATFNPDILNATRQIYAPLVGKARTAVQVTKDVAYGSDPRQTVDVYKPAQAADRAVIYIPGGGFVGGSKDGDDGVGPFYGNLGNYLADHGVLTFIANYRLAPAHPWPAGAQDVASVVAWVRANAKQYGGNPDRIVLYGQSAGATHCASYIFDSSFHPASGIGLAACILMSGPYKVEGELTAGRLAYFGADKSTYPARSPLTHIAKAPRIPLMLSVAEYDPGMLAAPTYELAQALTQRDGKSPHVAYFAGHNHVSTVMSFGTAQDDVGSVIREFVTSVK